MIPLRKIVNLVPAFFSYSASTVTGKPYIAGMPYSAGIELTNFCNLKCPECTTGSGVLSRSRGYMDIRLFEKITGEKDNGIIHLNLYFQGEPMMHPDFFRFIEISRSYITTVSTNGHFIGKDEARQFASSSLNTLIISLDGMSEETYLKYRRNGDYGKVIEGINLVSQSIRELRSSLKLEIQFLVNSFNEHELKTVAEFARSKGATLKLKSMQLLSPGEASVSWLPSEENFSRYSRSNSAPLIKSKLKNNCSRLWFNPVITWDGMVVPCCFDKDAGFVMGDINKNSFREIWYGKKYMDFRKALLSGRKDIPVCRNCTSGLSGVKI